MKRITQLFLAALVLTGIVGCDRQVEPGQESRAVETLVTAAKGHQDDLECPEGFEEFCGGWTIYQRPPTLAVHANLNDRFIIGVISGGPDPDLWLFPRDQPAGAGNNLSDRWNGTKKVKLRDESTDTDKCLVGVIQIKDHDGSGMSKFHSVTVRSEKITLSGDIGPEDDVTLCFKEQANASPPGMCTSLAECPDDDGTLDHGGRAHAAD